MVQLPEPLLLLAPGRSRSREGPVTPTISGGVRVVDGQYGQAWQVWQGTTNYDQNPISANVVHTNNGYINITRVRVSDLDLDHPTAGRITTGTRITATGAGGGFIGWPMDGAPVDQGATLTVGFWIKGSPGYIGMSGLIYTLELGGGASNRTHPGSSDVITGEWQYFEASLTIAEPDRTRVYCYFDLPRIDGEYVDWTAVQVEARADSTPLTIGDMGPGFAWTGTPHASSSTRAGGRVYSSAVSFPEAGSALFRFTVPEPGVTTYLCSLATISGNPTNLTIRRLAGGSLQVRDGTTYKLPPTETPPVGTPMSVYLEWTENAIGVDWGLGEGLQTSSRVFTHFANNNVWVGGAHPNYPGNTDTEGGVLFDRPLTEGERAYLMGMDEPLGWLNTGGSWQGRAALPEFRSSIYRIVPRIYEADRTGELGREITNAVTDAVVDADIDRAGPKGRIEISSRDAHTLQPNMWVAPFLNIRSEGRDEIDAQMGLYQLNQPSVTWDGLGDGLSKATGDDPVKIIQQATLETAQITHRNISVMGEVRRSIQIATMAKFGENIFPYTYDRPKTDWGSVSSDSSGWIGTDGLSTVAGARPRGDHSWFVRFDAGCPASGYRYLNATGAQYRFPVPEGATRLYVSHYRHCTHPFLVVRSEIRFYNAAGTEVGVSSRIGATYTAPEATGVWLSRIEVGDIPPEAVTMGLIVIVRTEEAITAAMGTVRAYIGGFEVGVALGEPIRTDALPSEFYSRSLTSAMTHEGGTSWLERINDLLTAIGLYGLNADNRGRYTTSELRDLGRDTPLREYELGVDSRVVGEVETDRIDSNFYNRVIVIREDYETKTAKIAVASNDDHESPYSTVNRGVVARVETVTDSTQDDALQALAESILARSSMQENIKLGLVPDPELTVYDIIEVLGDAGPRSGRWSIESWSSGLTSENPMVKVGARRTLTGINR